MIIKFNMEKVIAQLNEFTTKVMTSFRYCRKVYDGGFDSDYAAEQFATFMNLCQSHVNLCNSLCKKVKPRFKFFQWSKYKMYKAFRDTCAYTVEEIQAMINRASEFMRVDIRDSLDKYVKLTVRAEAYR